MKDIDGYMNDRLTYKYRARLIVSCNDNISDTLPSKNNLPNTFFVEFYKNLKYAYTPVLPYLKEREMGFTSI